MYSLLNSMTFTITSISKTEVFQFCLKKKSLEKMYLFIKIFFYFSF